MDVIDCQLSLFCCIGWTKQQRVLMNSVVFNESTIP